MASMPAPLPSRRRDPRVEADRLADCVRRLGPRPRALLDLSVRRKLRDDAMAPLLHADAFHLAWRRARALEQVASDVAASAAPPPPAMGRSDLQSLPASASDPLSAPPLPKKTSAPESSTELVPTPS